MALRPGKKDHSTRKRQAPEEQHIPLPPEAQKPAKRRRLSIGSIGRLLVTVVRYTLIGGLALLCAGVFFVAVIMGEAPELGHEEAEQNAVLEEPAPLPGAGEFASQELSVLAAYFPASTAQLASGSGLSMQQGTVQDVEVDGLTCRVVSLQYRVGQDSLTLRSATPVGYLKRYGAADAVLSPEVVMLGALPGISLRTVDQQVIMARQGELLYALEAPVGFSGLEQLGAWVVYE